jgi:hypothetical protein
VSSSISRAKHQPGGVRSAQTLGSTKSMKVLAIASGAAVAAECEMQSRSTSVPVRIKPRGLVQAPRSARLRSRVSSQRFAAKDLCPSMRWLQSVRGAAATRKAVPSFTAGSGGGMVTVCSSSQHWRFSGQGFVLSSLGSQPCSPRAVLPNPSLERTRTGMALGPRGAPCHHSPRGPSATPALPAQLKR